jgi:hypothetical protein
MEREFELNLHIAVQLAPARNDKQPQHASKTDELGRRPQCALVREVESYVGDTGQHPSRRKDVNWILRGMHHMRDELRLPQSLGVTRKH